MDRRDQSAAEVISVAVHDHIFGDDFPKDEATCCGPAVIEALEAAGFAVVGPLPPPTDVSDWGPVWESSERMPPDMWGGLGTVQYRPEIERIEVRDDYEHDYQPEALEQDALVLLAAVRWWRDKSVAADGQEKP